MANQKQHLRWFEPQIQAIRRGLINKVSTYNYCWVMAHRQHFNRA